MSLFKPKEMKAESSLLKVYEFIEKRILEDSGSFTAQSIKAKLPSLLEYYGTLNSICAVHAEDFMLVVNESERVYYGVNENELSDRNLSFVRSVLHPTSFMTALHSQNFFSRPQSKKFKAFWRLKCEDGSSQKFYGITGAIATNDEGLATHVLSLKCKQSELALFHALEVMQHQGLLGRPRQVLQHLLSGYTVDEIAAQLGCSSKTIEKDLTGIYRKANVKNRAELMMKLS